MPRRKQPNLVTGEVSVRGMTMETAEKLFPSKKSPCLLGMLGIHRYKLEKETTRFSTNIRTYKCGCGKEKLTYQPFGFKKEFKLK